MNRTDIRRWTFLLFVALVSVAFAWIVSPFFGAVFWGVVLAIMLTPLYERTLGLTRQRRALASVLTVIVCLVGGIAPLALLIVAIVREGATLYQKVSSQQIDVAAFFNATMNVLPGWTLKLLDALGLGDVAAFEATLSNVLAQWSRALAGHAFSVGQNTFDFVLNAAIVLYLLFFLLRDGKDLVARLERALPLSDEHKAQLFSKFGSVIRATVKGNLVIAVVQGVLGSVALTVLGIEAPLLWGALMAVLSLLPVVGSALVWGPIAVYLLFTGAILEGAGLIVFGTVVIGLVDNLLRPLLVGKDTQLPDYVVLISTLGGIALLGFSGFVIGPVVAGVFVVTWQQFTVAQASLED